MQTLQRRSFLNHIAAASALPFIPNHLLSNPDIDSLNHYRNTKTDPATIVNDEQFWYQVKTMYSSSPGLLNLNNGGVSPQPLIVQEPHERSTRMSNGAPSYYMWRSRDQGREALRQRLADMAGVSNEEVAVCRNASEALEPVIF